MQSDTHACVGRWLRYRAVLEAVPDEPRALNNVGAVLQLMKQHDLAVEYFQRCVCAVACVCLCLCVWLWLCQWLQVVVTLLLTTVPHSPVH